MSDPGSTKIPSVVFDLADVLPQFQGADLESQLQNFDYFLEMLSPEARPALATVLRGAAAKTHDHTSRQRIAAAAQSVAGGGRAAAPYNHEEAMRAYRAQHAANYPDMPVGEPSVPLPPDTAPQLPPLPQRSVNATPPIAPPRPPGNARQVDEAGYSAAIRQANAVKDPTLPRHTIGEVERWLAPDGKVVAWLIVRYFKGEHDYDYYIAV